MTSRHVVLLRWVFLVGGFLLTGGGAVLGQEIRALWADTFHAALRTSQEVSQLVADARAGNFNTVMVEVRKRGDAYYNSLYEPKAVDVSPQSFDPLADLLAKAHDTNAGPRMEVHAWIVTYNIWNQQSVLPSQPNHPYRLHPDWLTQTSGGTTWDGANYAFDPGHPGVQEHTFRVAMDLVSRYDIDGLHFDYVRYADNIWGYHPVAVERFNRLHGRTGTPSATDSQWRQFRRDQVTALLRKVYLHAAAVKPRVRISAATIAWAPGITTDTEWLSSAAYASVLQDWRGWMEEGILDLNVPMAYFREHTANAADWADWSQFAKDHRYRRQVAMGSGIYLNYVSNSIAQIRSTRVPTPSGNRADGVACYSYAVTSVDGVPRSTFLAALTTPGPHDPNPVPVFAEVATVPDMPWKSAPTLGHLLGAVTNAGTGLPVDGATVVLVGPVSRTGRSDATGSFGSVDLPPGDYQVSASFPGLQPQSAPLRISAGAVARQTFFLVPPTGAGFFQLVRVSPGATAALLAWRSESACRGWIEFGPETNAVVATPVEGEAVVDHETLLAGLQPDTGYWFRLAADTPAGRRESEWYFFRTAGSLLVDNPNASFSGSWTVGTSATDKYSTNYHFAGVVAGNATATAVFAPQITTPGRYDIQVWYPQGANRSAAAPFQVNDGSSSTIFPVNQTTGGGGWRTLVAGRYLPAGTVATVRLLNNSGESGRVVMADAVRFVYAAGQEPPPPGAVPDWWSQFHFGGPVDASLDPDGDGYTTAAEYVLGTLPDDARSTFRVGVEAVGAAAVRIDLAPAVPGRMYRLQQLQQMSPPVWGDLATTPLRTNGLGGGAFDLTNTTGNAYFRVSVDWAP